MKVPAQTLLPVLPVKNMVMYPGISVPLIVGRKKSVAAVQKAQQSDNWILVVTQKDADLETEPTGSDLYQIGCLCKIEKIRGTPEQGLQVFVRSLARFRVTQYYEATGFVEANA